MIELSIWELLLLVFGVPFALLCYYYELRILYSITVRLKNEKIINSQYSPEEILTFMKELKDKKTKGNKNKKKNDDISYGSMYQ